MIAVVGVSRFLGRAICSQLDSIGKATRLISRRGDHEFLAGLENAEFVESDLSEGEYERCLDGVESVVFLVNQLLPSAPIDCFPDELGSSIAMQCRFLQACCRAGVKRVVYTSSGGTVYGATATQPISESVPAMPISAYGAVNLTIETYLRLLSHEYGVDSSLLRIANAYGPGQPVRREQGVIASLLFCASRGELFEVYGDGSVVRDFIHVSDVSDAVCKSLDSPVGGCRTYNVGSGEGHSIRDMVATVMKVTKQQFPVRYTSARTGDVKSNVLDCARFQNEVGWSPRLGLEEGIADTWEWFLRSSPGRLS